MIQKQDFTKIENDTFGKSRWVCHYSKLLTAKEIEKFEGVLYRKAILRANKFGGKRFDTARFPEHIVFQPYNLQNLVDKINNILI